MTAQAADVVVLGAGSGGYATAIRAAELGKSVVLIEKDRVGGTCLHRGCVPTKALLHAAEIAEDVRGAAEIGVRATLDGIDPVALQEWRDRIVRKKFAGLTSLVAARGITVVEGSGRVLPDRSVRVGEDVYTAPDLVIATGAVSRSIPGVEFGERILDSERALALPVIPQRAIVLGGGVIGVEFASLWRSLGAEVTVVEALDHLVPNEEDALRKGLERAFRKRGIQLRLGARVQSAQQSADEVSLVLEDGTVLDGDYLLVAVGRAPATDDLDLEEAGVARDRGFVPVDADGRTGVPGVWAVGDITPGPQLAHRGFQQGIAVAERIAGLSPAPTPDSQVPRVTYSRPELASVGLTSKEAAERHGADDIVRYEYNLAGNAKSEIIGTGGSVTVIRRVDGPILGVHLIGDRVGELITEGQLAVAWEAHPEDLAPLIHAHPTQSEALGEAFLALAGKPLHAL